MAKVVTTRHATSADAQLLIKFTEDAFRDEFRSAFSSELQIAAHIVNPFNPDFLRTDIELGRAEFQLGFVDGVAAGFAKLERTLPPECVGCAPAIELSQFLVLDQFRGCEIAIALIEQCLNIAKQRGLSQIWVATPELNLKAYPFFRERGFESVGEQMMTWGETNCRLIIMTKSIDSVETQPPATLRRPAKIDERLSSDDSIQSLVVRFEACTWPLDRWTHRAHLAVGLSYARSMSFDEALDQLRNRISLYNQACGDPSGYNETVTRLFLRKITSTCCRTEDIRPAHVIVEDLVSTCTVTWLYRYYSKERIWSPEAKATWVAPDLQPLDF